MNVAAAPKIREQIDPRALAIIDAIEPIPDGYHESGVPIWRGPSEEFWTAISQKPELDRELQDILKTDFPTYCAVLLKIKNKMAGHLSPFIFSCAQLLVWNKIAWIIANGLDLFLAILKTRQQGISTIVLAWEHWNLWRLTDTEVLMVGDDKLLCQKFISTMEVFHQEMPARFRPRLRSNSGPTGRIPKHEMQYIDRRNKAITSTDEGVSARGLSAPNQHFSEASHYVNFEEILLTLMPMLPPVGSAARRNASMLVETTANGQNYFYDFYKLSKSGDSDWQAMFLPWFVSEDIYSVEPPANWKMDAEEKMLQKKYSSARKLLDGKEVTRAQMYWRFRETANQGWNEDMFDQEYPSDDETCFLMRSKSIFKGSMKYLEACCVRASENVESEWRKRNIEVGKCNYVAGELKFPEGVEPPNPFDAKNPWRHKRFEPVFERKKGGPLSVWSPPQTRHAYVVGIDTAEGLSDRDWSVGWVLDVTTAEQVGEFRAHLPLEKFADYMVMVGYWYNTAILYPEINSIGRQVMKRIKRDWGYPKVGLEEKWDEVSLRKDKYGLMMNEDMKKQLVTELYGVITERYLAIASRITLSELSTFEQDENGKFDAQNGAHDDCAIGAGLAVMCVRQSPKLQRSFQGNRHEAVPDTWELGLSSAPRPAIMPPMPDGTDDPFKDMPAEIRKMISSNAPVAVPTNPMRGW